MRLSRKRLAFCCSEHALRGWHPFAYALLRLTYSNDAVICRTTYFATHKQRMRCVIHTLRYAYRLQLAFVALSRDMLFNCLCVVRLGRDGSPVATASRDCAFCVVTSSADVIADMPGVHAYRAYRACPDRHHGCDRKQRMANGKPQASAFNARALRHPYRLPSSTDARASV